ncbi:MAG: hypothetical protein ACJAYU_001140 [Bradymonadia bacterium]|jgi:hypothetical protein
MAELTLEVERAWTLCPSAERSIGAERIGAVDQAVVVVVDSVIAVFQADRR